MIKYRVYWIVDVTAKNPKQAALEAQAIQYDQVNNICMPGVFDVYAENSSEAVEIDLARDEEEDR